jgi:hypothetical protein
MARLPLAAVTRPVHLQRRRTPKAPLARFNFQIGRGSTLALPSWCLIDLYGFEARVRLARIRRREASSRDHAKLGIAARQGKVRANAIYHWMNCTRPLWSTV